MMAKWVSTSLTVIQGCVQIRCVIFRDPKAENSTPSRPHESPLKRPSYSQDRNGNMTWKITKCLMVGLCYLKNTERFSNVGLIEHERKQDYLFY